MTDGAVRVGLLRHHAAGGDPLAARLRLEAVLTRAEVAPTRLPPSAVLCIRRLGDPRPRTLLLDGRSSDGSGAWERAVSNELDDALRSAARPAHEHVPAGANAVVFADRAELLACFARDRLAGTFATGWWWRGLDVAASTDNAVSAVFEREPRHVPRAMALLARWGWAVQFVAALSPREAARLAADVGTTFGLPAVRRVAARLGGSPNPSRGVGRLATSHRSFAEPPPWTEIAPEALAVRGEPARDLLLGIALSIERGPTTVRSNAFADAVELWFAGVIAAAQGPLTALEPGPVSKSGPAAPAKPTTDRRRRSTTGDSIPPLKAGGVPSRPRLGEGARAARPPRQRHRPLRSGAHHDPPAVHSGSDGRPHAAHAAPAGVNVGTRSRTEIAPLAEPETLDTEVIDTELGGIFYLLDLALYLGLYGDFTQPERQGLELDPWDFLSLLATALGAADGAADDPVWPLLARLAGRDPQSRPGARFVAPADWRIPVDWLRPFATTSSEARPWHWSAARARLRIHHPAEFPVVDVAVRGEVTHRTVRAAVRRYGPGIHLRRSRLIGASVRPVGRRPVDRWIAWIAAYGRARLALALDLDDPRMVVDVLLRHPARIVVSPTAIDVAFALVDLPIAVRIAGLDRDPGWIPAAGRDVRFRFE